MNVYSKLNLIINVISLQAKSELRFFLNFNSLFQILFNFLSFFFFFFISTQLTNYLLQSPISFYSIIPHPPIYQINQSVSPISYFFTNHFPNPKINSLTPSSPTPPSHLLQVPASAHLLTTIPSTTPLPSQPEEIIPPICPTEPSPIRPTPPPPPPPAAPLPAPHR